MCLFFFLPSSGQSTADFFFFFFNDHCSLFFLLLTYSSVCFSLRHCSSPASLVENINRNALLIRTCLQSGSVQKLTWFLEIGLLGPHFSLPAYSLALFQVCQQPVGSQFTKNRIILGKYDCWKSSKYWSWQLLSCVCSLQFSGQNRNYTRGHGIKHHIWLKNIGIIEMYNSYF